MRMNIIMMAAKRALVPPDMPTRGDLEYGSIRKCPATAKSVPPIRRYHKALGP